MTHSDMTIAEILKDPLIRQVMSADRISLRKMKRLLRKAADALGASDGMPLLRHVPKARSKGQSAAAHQP